MCTNDFHRGSIGHRSTIHTSWSERGGQPWCDDRSSTGGWGLLSLSLCGTTTGCSTSEQRTRMYPAYLNSFATIDLHIAHVRETLRLLLAACKVNAREAVKQRDWRQQSVSPSHAKRLWRHARMCPRMPAESTRPLKRLQTGLNWNTFNIEANDCHPGATAPMARSMRWRSSTLRPFHIVQKESNKTSPKCTHIIKVSYFSGAI